MTRSFSVVAALASVACIGSASHAGPPIPDEVQSFLVTYAEHGSSGSQQFDLYSGPLHLSSVKIEWSATVDRGYFDYLSWLNDDGNTYTQPYSGEGGFFTYSGESDTKGFSGNVLCHSYGCDVGGDVSGIAYFTPDDFIGSGSGTIDCFCDISPDFSDYPGAWFYEDVTGTITYSFDAAPEPASWALMLGGFGLVGGAMRSRRRAAITFA